MSDGTREVLPDFPSACELFVVGLVVTFLLTRRGVIFYDLQLREDAPSSYLSRI
jgi:hypothetical protein